MLFSDPAECQLNSPWPVTTQRGNIVVIMRVDTDARQVAGVCQEPHLATERLLVSSVDFRR